MPKPTKTATTLLDAFEERGDDWTFSEFDRAMKAAMGRRYHGIGDSRMAIIGAEAAGHWPKTVARYLLTNMKAFGSLPIELVPIARKHGIGTGHADG